VAEAELRSRYGVSILAIRRTTREGERRFVPAPTDRFQHGDVLVLLGSEEAIARVKEAGASPAAARP
jgi:K+/H+ antiporter YhaU regulatory subunit KhtT